MRRLVTLVGLVGLCAGTAVCGVSPAHAVTPAEPFDLDGNGNADLVAGVPLEGVGGAEYAGALNVVHGSATGLTASGSQLWSQDRPGVRGVSEQDDSFGLTIASGDFDGDGFADVAAGAPGETLGDASFTGAVNVLYGTSTGLSAERNQLWGQEALLGGANELGDMFGGALASGDFDADGFDDLAVGASNEDVSLVEGAGAVYVLKGSASGLTATGAQTFTQATPGVPDEPELVHDQSGDIVEGFGSAVSAADVDGDSFDDLAVGVPGESEGRLAAGAVHLLRGSASGLTTVGTQLWHQNSPGIPGTAANFDHFGSELAFGHLNADARADLAVGVQDKGLPHCGRECGMVDVLYGGPSGLRASGAQAWHQDSPGIHGEAEAGDRFGTALATGDVTGDGHGDLVVGVPHERIGPAGQAQGVIQLVRGSAGGLTDSGDVILSQATPGVAGAPETGDLFGFDLAVLPYGRSSPADVAVDVEGEHVGRAGGMAQVFYGSPPGPSVVGEQQWHQDQPGVPGTGEPEDRFGRLLGSNGLSELP